eukprot:scaffold7294_cov93-Cylindrotheca_fusiformis.AAC.10
MVFSFQQAALTNNEGVTALVEGDKKQAIQLLMKTVRMMKQLLAKPDSEHVEEEQDEAAAASCMDDFKTVELSGDDSGDNFFFRRAILLPSAADEIEESPTDLYVYSAAVIFNLALAHHVDATNKKDNMVKAEKLYGAILKLLDGRVGNLQPVIVLKLACIHNMSYIRFELGKYDEVKQSLSDLSTLLKKTDKVLFERPDAQGLIMNVLLLKNHKVAPAA